MSASTVLRLEVGVSGPVVRWKGLGVICWVIPTDFRQEIR